MIKKVMVIATLLLLVAIVFIACGSSKPKLSTVAVPTAGGTINPASGTYDKGVRVNVTAIPASGYRFDHWEGSVSGESPAVQLVMDGNKELNAHFAKTYTLSVSPAPASGGTVSSIGGTYDAGKQVTLIATPAQYYKFNGWSGDVSGNSDHLTVMVDSNKQVVASFVKLTPLLNTHVDPSGSGTVDPSSGPVEAGTQRTISAVPSNGYRFDHWGGSISGASTTAGVFMDGPKDITAYFIKQYTLNVSSDPSEGGRVDPATGLVDAGTKIQLNAVASFPYYLKNWIGTDNNDISPTITISNDTSVTAIFEECQKGESKTSSGPVSNDERWSPVTSVPILLNQFDWIQGEIVFATPNNRSTPIRSYIQDPAGNILNEFGSSRQSNFSFMAQTTGNYNVVFQNNSIWWAGYTLTYTPWTKP